MLSTNFNRLQALLNALIVFGLFEEACGLVVVEGDVVRIELDGLVVVLMSGSEVLLLVRLIAEVLFVDSLNSGSMRIK
jgi:hypothetical protein